MADDQREKRGLIAKWREHRTHEAEPSGQAAERVALKAEERARLQQARDIARCRNQGRRPADAATVIVDSSPDRGCP